MVKIKFDIPEEITEITKKIQNSGFEAFLVGGCVRDLFLNIKPKDWDIATNAKPEDIQNIFEHTFYENNFGTVGVVNDKKDIDETLKIVEVTPYRLESTYSNNRHPDQVKFSNKLEDDLKRRDFTINALCYNPQTKEIIDLYNGINDLQKKELRTVGKPDERFQEDSLRILRAMRFTTQLGFTINEETKKSIKKNEYLLKNISKERIRDEFLKILNTKDITKIFFLMLETNVINHISPKFREAVGVIQGGGHKFDVFEHLVRTCQHAIDKNWSEDIRLAALFHDIGKPKTARWNKEKNKNTFYGHEVVGAHVTKQILTNLKFPVKQREKVVNLVRNHMFFSDPDKITLSAVRRIIRKVGGEKNVWDLIKLRICDRIGMGRPKEQPYRLRQYQAMIEEAMRSPISVKDLKINGEDLMNLFSLKPGPKIGLILNALMAITLFKPENNNRKFLIEQSEKYSILSDSELKSLAESGKEAIIEKEKEEIKKLHKKHSVK